MQFLEDTSIEPTSPTTPQQPRKTPPRHINTTHPAFITTLGSFSPNAQMESWPSDESISQVLQEIRTLERIANRLNDLYCLHDRLLQGLLLSGAYYYSKSFLLSCNFYGFVNEFKCVPPVTICDKKDHYHD